METTFRKNIDFNEVIKIDGKTVATCNGNISTNDVESCSLSFGINNYDLYRENRDEIAAERAAFENTVWDEQDKLKEEQAE